VSQRNLHFASHEFGGGDFVTQMTAVLFDQPFTAGSGDEE